MRDCYKILGVPRTASIAEIRRAYRQKAKLLHPDITHADSEAFRDLVAAYETLTDAKTRSLFDESVAAKGGGRTGGASGTHGRQGSHADGTFASEWEKTRRGYKSFDYRQWLLARADEESRAKLILLDLTHGREDDAVKEFKRMNSTSHNFRLSHWFTREDFMDYGFILAEELVLRHEYYDAVILLDQIIQMEYSYEYFKLFFPEVKDLARHILRNNIEGTVSDELALDAWERALELRLGAEDDIFFLHKMACAYERMGDARTAKACRDEAVRLAT